MGRFQWVPRTSVSVNVRHFLESTIYFSDILVRVWERNCQPKYVVGNQRNRLNGTVPMSTQNKCLSNCLTLFWSQHIYITDYKIRVLEKSCQPKPKKKMIVL